MKIIVPFAGTENVSFQPYILNMPKLYYLCFILYRNPSFAEPLEGKINEHLHIQFCVSFRWPQLLLLFLYFFLKLYLACVHQNPATFCSSPFHFYTQPEQN